METMTEQDALVQKIEALLTAPLAGLGLRLLEVVYRQEGHWVLRLILDKDGGVSLDDCGEASELAGRILDVEDIIPQSYALEVSSAGLTRPLKERRHYEQSVGKLAKLVLAPGVLPERKDHILRGTIESLSGDDVTLNVAGETVTVPLKGIKSAKLDPDF